MKKHTLKALISLIENHLKPYLGYDEDAEMFREKWYCPICKEWDITKETIPHKSFCYWHK